MTVNKLCVASVLLLATMVLSCCSMGVSVATSGAEAVYSRNSLKQGMNDNYIKMLAYRKIYEDTRDFNHANISIAVLNNDVLLTGEVLSPELSAEAVQIIKTIPGVDQVFNHINVSAPSSILTTMSDDWITTKIRSKLIAADNVDPSRIKVVTENGVVHLMGIVFLDEAKTTVDIASHTQGVQAVVKHFYYLRLSKK